MKKNVMLIFGCLTILLMVGCGGPSEEKVKEAQDTYTELVSKHNEVIEEYAGVDDKSFDKQLNDMAVKINNLGQQEMKEKTDEEIDIIITELKTNIQSYDDILKTIQKMKESVTKKAEGIPVTIKNNTGLKLYQLYLYEASNEEKGNNLVEDMEYMDGYDTINILNLYVTMDKPVWQLEAYDREGKIVESAEYDFTGKEEGAYIKMQFSFDKMEGWLEDKETIEEEETKEE